MKNYVPRSLDFKDFIAFLGNLQVLILKVKSWFSKLPEQMLKCFINWLASQGFPGMIKIIVKGYQLFQKM